MRLLFVVPWLAVLAIACDPPRAPYALSSKTGATRGDAGTRIVRPDGGSQQGDDASQDLEGGVIADAGSSEAGSSDAASSQDASGEIDTTAPFPDSGGGNFGDAAAL